MKKIAIIILGISVLSITACKKNEDTATVSFDELKTIVLTDFSS